MSPCPKTQLLQALRPQESPKPHCGDEQTQAGYSDLGLLSSPHLVSLINTLRLGVAFPESHIPATDAVTLPKICFLLMQLILGY